VAKIRIGIVGFGKIAQDQHRPAIEADLAFQLSAVVSPDAKPDLSIPVFADVHRSAGRGGDLYATRAAPRHRPRLP